MSKVVYQDHIDNLRKKIPYHVPFLTYDVIYRRQFAVFQYFWLNFSKHLNLMSITEKVAKHDQTYIFKKYAFSYHAQF